MSQTLIRAFDNQNRPILAGNKPVERIHFNLVKSAPGQTYQYRLPHFETVIVPLAGVCDLSVDDQTFASLGNRASVWAGKADSIYAGPNTEVVIVARNDCEVAVAGGLWNRPTAPFSH